MKPAECVRRILLFEKPEYIPNWDNGPMSPRVEAEWHKQGPLCWPTDFRALSLTA